MTTRNQKNALMVLSGGMDSVTMLHEYASEIELAVIHVSLSAHASTAACSALSLW